MRFTLAKRKLANRRIAPQCLIYGYFMHECRLKRKFCCMINVRPFFIYHFGSKKVHSYLKEAKSIIKLGTPVFVAQIAQNSMGFVDTVMAGKVSATDMAAVAVASSIWFPAIIFGIGVLMAMVPVIAQLNGSGRTHKIPFQFQQGIYLALALCLPIIFILTQAGYIIDFMDVEPQLAEKTIGYLNAVVWAVPAFLLFLSVFIRGIA